MAFLPVGILWRRIPSHINPHVGPLVLHAEPPGLPRRLRTGHGPLANESSGCPGPIANPRILMCWCGRFKEPARVRIVSQSPHRQMVSVLTPGGTVCRPGVALPPLLLLGSQLRALGYS